MLTRDALVVDLAQNVALVPLLFLAARRRHVDEAWWWLAGAFAVSWLADAWAYVMPVSDRWVPSLIYPLAQSALIGAVLLPRRSALMLLGVLTATGFASVITFGANGPDLTLRSVAWIAVVGIVALDDGLPRRLRFALAVYFGLGLVAWILHAASLIVATWYGYQAIRLVGLALFCNAAAHPIELRVIRGRLTRSRLRARAA